MMRRADAALAELNKIQRIIARRIFLRLIQFGEGRPDTRRQQTVNNLRSADDSSEEFNHTLESLVSKRLLTRSGKEADEYARVDIAHEALIGGWPTLRTWIKERRNSEQTRRRLEAKVADWQRLERRGGLLDEVEVREAEHWLESSDAAESGYSPNLPEFVIASKKTIESELEHTRKTAKKLRQFAVFAITFAVMALLAAAGAFWGGMQSNLNFIEALTQSSKALFLLQNDDLGALLILT